MSSILFLKTALEAEYLHAYATHKLLLQGFPVHVIEQRTAMGHPIISVCYVILVHKILIYEYKIVQQITLITYPTGNVIKTKLRRSISSIDR